MRHVSLSTIALAACLIAASPAHAKTPGERLTDAKDVFQELLATPDRGVPETLLNDAKCIAVIPGVIKAALGIGGRHGLGVMSCRDEQGHWSTPTFVSITGGSFGFQMGAESADVVLFFMNERGAKSLITGNKFTLGGQASVAAGPLGRSGEASTDLELKAEIYSYAKSKGLFAGLSLEGAKLGPDNNSNKTYYGGNVTAQQLLFEHVTPAEKPEVEAFRSVLPDAQRAAQHE